MNRLKVAVVGAGHLGRIHARLLAQRTDVELVGIADPNVEARTQTAAACGATPHADYAPLLDAADAAIVATPTRHHHQVALDWLNRGKHAFIEKPLAAGAAEADELVAAARRRGVVLQVGHVERFNPALAAAAPHLHDPKYLDACRLSGFKFRSTDIGVVLDLMIHDIDVVLSLVRSPVVQVEALGVALFGKLEDAATARLVFANGAVANLTASRASYVAVRRLHAWTARSFASLDFAARTATLVRPGREIAERRFSVESLSPPQQAHLAEHLFEELLPREQLETVPGDQITAEQTDFVESIRHGREPRVNGEAGRDALAVAEQVLAAIDRHAWDGNPAGRAGPLLLPARQSVAPPHFPLVGEPSVSPRRQAG